MRVHITGNVSEYDVQDTLEEAVSVWHQKLTEDNPELDEIFETAEDCRIAELTADLQFKIGDKWQVITTDNHSEAPELLVVEAETDEDGELIWDSVKDNDGASNFNDIEAMIVAGKVKSIRDLPEIESKLTAVAVLSRYDFSSEGFFVEVGEVIETAKIVVQVLRKSYHPYAEDELVAEAVFPSDKLDEVKQHYLELWEATR